VLRVFLICSILLMLGSTVDARRDDLRVNFPGNRGLRMVYKVYVFTYGLLMKPDVHDLEYYQS